ncbi:MAG: hypothetical protein M3Q33_13810 [Acidobacteriota bacterium]|nr:hypothetical protein [Acidobacteriota bacterium]
MNKLFQNTAFNLGFWCGLVLFAFINFLSYIKAIHEFSTADFAIAPIRFSSGGYSFGFPFILYKTEIGYPNHFYFVWSGLIANILIAIVFSFIVGFVVNFMWSKIVSRRSS